MNVLLSLRMPAPMITKWYIISIQMVWINKNIYILLAFNNRFLGLFHTCIHWNLLYRPRALHKLNIFILYYRVINRASMPQFANSYFLLLTIGIQCLEMTTKITNTEGVRKENRGLKTSRCVGGTFLLQRICHGLLYLWVFFLNLYHSTSFEKENVPCSGVTYHTFWQLSRDSALLLTQQLDFLSKYLLTSGSKDIFDDYKPA